VLLASLIYYLVIVIYQKLDIILVPLNLNCLCPCNTSCVSARSEVRKLNTPEDVSFSVEVHCQALSSWQAAFQTTFCKIKFGA
jgi:hypothetical protein